MPHLLICSVRLLVENLCLLRESLGTMSEAMKKALGALRSINSELRNHVVPSITLHIYTWILAKFWSLLQSRCV